MAGSSPLAGFCAGLALLGGLVRPAGAQVAPPATGGGRSYYVGLGGAVGSYQLAADHTSSILAPVLGGGVRLAPRLALEASLLLHHDGFDETSSGIYSTSQTPPLPATFHSRYQQRTQALSVLARYALLRPLARRWQLDAVAGAALVHTDAYGYNETLDQATGTYVRGGYYVRYDLTGGGLLLGPSLRYQLAGRVELVGEYVANFAPGGQSSHPLARLSGTLGLSARYCFGRRSQ